MRQFLQSATLFIICFTTSISAQDLSSIYEKVSPAVVVIVTSEKKIVTSSNHISKKIDFKGLGSGFMISDRLVVTAAHVVTAPETLNIVFPDGDVIPGSVVSSYRGADIALIKLMRPRINAVTVSFGDSDALKIGERIFVIGAPFGLNTSLSSGYVSSFKRSSFDQNPFTSTDFIQTDAAINQGNSGGPMFNLNGEVVGIVSHITTQSGGFEGIGYASSSNIASRLLLNNKMPWLGADFYTLSEKEAQLLNVPQKYGLLVKRVVVNSIFGEIGVRGGDTEAAIAGTNLILGGDIILAFNDIPYALDNKTLNKLAEFASNINETPNFKLTVLRQGKVIELKR
ncbi:MAG: trypsin-like peptidase domain-containing protein [Flavobacteriaceae bacterium]|nr:trypsin-like peptidase domain-containing protein [Flavobacteriaceae bacterium]